MGNPHITKQVAQLLAPNFGPPGGGAVIRPLAFFSLARQKIFSTKKNGGGLGYLVVLLCPLGGSVIGLLGLVYTSPVLHTMGTASIGGKGVMR